MLASPRPTFNNIVLSLMPVGGFEVDTRERQKNLSALTESNGTGHIWSKFGDDMGEAMAHTCLTYGLNMGCCPTYQTHMEPLCSIYCLLLWGGYVFRKVPYIIHSMWFGNGMGVPHTNTICS